MIDATMSDGARFAARLAAKAARIAAAQVERDVLTRRRAPGRWRRAGLLWPLFVGNDRENP